MTSTTSERPARSSVQSSGETSWRTGLSGTAALVRLALRRDRVRLPVWIGSLGLMTVYAVQALNGLYPTAADRQVRAVLVSNPAAVMLTGPGYGLSDYTLGAMIANEFALSLVVASAIMSILAVVRHTRAEEETGRAELVRAGATGAYAPLVAAGIVAVLANLGVGVVEFGALLGGGLAAGDSMALVLGMAGVSLVFAGFAAVAAQVAASARAATGIGLALLGLAFAVRAVGDVRERGGSLLSWFSPIAWMHQLRPYVDLRWWPLLLCLALTVLTGAAALVLVGRRDVGAGLVAPRPGRREAPATLSGPLGLAWRQQRGSILAWSIALAAMFAASGSLVQTVADSMSEMPPAVVAMLGLGGEDLVVGFLAVMGTLAALAVGAFAVASMLRSHAEDQAGRSEPVLAGAVSRARWLACAVLLAAAAAAGLLLVSGLALGLGAAAVSDGGNWMGRSLAATLVYVPAVLVLIGLTAALYGLRGGAAAYSWLVVAYTVVVGLFGGLLRLPDWAANLSPFQFTPQLPVQEFSAGPLLLLLGLASVLMLIGTVSFRRRDLS